MIWIPLAAADVRRKSVGESETVRDWVRLPRSNGYCGIGDLLPSKIEAASNPLVCFWELKLAPRTAASGR